jgi:hypothetical protein
MLTCKFVNYFLKMNLFGAQYTVTIDLGELHIYMYIQAPRLIHYFFFIAILSSQSTEIHI